MHIMQHDINTLKFIILSYLNPCMHACRKFSLQTKKTVIDITANATNRINYNYIDNIMQVVILLRIINYIS